MGQVRYDARKDKDSFIRLPTAPGYSDDGGRILSKQALSAIIDVKVQDILEKIYYRIRDKSLHTQLGYGVVLTEAGLRFRASREWLKKCLAPIWPDARLTCVSDVLS